MFFQGLRADTSALEVKFQGRSMKGCTYVNMKLPNKTKSIFIPGSESLLKLINTCLNISALIS